MNLLGIDFEDWFHPQIIQRYLDDKKKKPAVINSIDKILDLLRKTDTYATFFVVGELLEYKHEILDKILGGGHEIGFHTMHHDRIDSPKFSDSAVQEIDRFTELTSKKSKGFRAPTFSLNHSSAWVIDVLVKSGYQYDSSVVPVKTSMYGLPEAQREPYRISSRSIEKNDPEGKLLEFPLLVTRFLGKKIPAAGGFYLRILPLKVIKNAISDYEKLGIPASFYIHSWELAPELMPRIPMSFKDGFITYHNIEKAFSKLEYLLKNFSFTSFIRYMEQSDF